MGQVMRRIYLHHGISHGNDVRDHSLIDVLLGLQEGMEFPLGHVSSEVGFVFTSR